MSGESAERALRRAAKGIPTGRIGVLCVGNPLRGDDAFGPAVFEAVSGRIAAAAVFNGAETPENALPALARLEPRLVIVVDAVVFGGAAGELALLEPGGMRMDGFDTHTASLSVVAEFLREACGARVLVLAAQPACMDMGAELTPSVKEAVERAADIIADALPAD